MSIVDTAKDRVVQTIATRPWPASRVGYEPTGIALTEDGHLLVSLGRANAVAVYRWYGRAQEPVSYLGLLPTDFIGLVTLLAVALKRAPKAAGIDADIRETKRSGSRCVPAPAA